MALNVAEITNVLKQEIAGFEQRLEVSDVGTVIEVGDGIARVYGLRNAMAGELLEFRTGGVPHRRRQERDGPGLQPRRGLDRRRHLRKLS
jgi:F-type H+/Na+-transporting ATPase subunit alpha